MSLFYKMIPIFLVVTSYNVKRQHLIRCIGSAILSLNAYTMCKFLIGGLHHLTPSVYIRGLNGFLY